VYLRSIGKRDKFIKAFLVENYMDSKSFWSKISYSGRKNCLIVHIPVSVAKLLKLKIGQRVRIAVRKK